MNELEVDLMTGAEKSVRINKAERHFVNKFDLNPSNVRQEDTPKNAVGQ